MPIIPFLLLTNSKMEWYTVCNILEAGGLEMAEDKLNNEVEKGDEVDFSRRVFLKKTLLLGVAVAGTTVVAKKVASVAPRQDLRGAYLNDELQQDKVMKDKQYVLMTREEKDQMVQMFEKEYKYTA
jgi:hypothetical protein